MMRTLALFLFFSLSAHAASWSEVDQLAGEQKLQAALEKTEVILKEARAKKDEALAAEALLRATQFEMGLGGMETAVRKLKEKPWPAPGPHRVLLELYYGHALLNYQRLYGYEVAQREKTVSRERVDLKAWTKTQIGEEINAAFDAAMAEGSWLDRPVPEFFKAYLEKNTFPAGVRPYLRDAIVYLAVERLEDQSFWNARESSEIYKLDLKKLLSEGESSERIPAAQAGRHPLERAVSWLGELRQRHLSGGRGEAAMEARYRVFEILQNAFSEESDRALVREALVGLQKNSRLVGAWWAKGQAQLASLYEMEGGSQGKIRARTALQEGIAAYPSSLGAKMCESQLFQIERPEFSLAAKELDAPGKRSLLLEYRNISKVYFRVYRRSLDAVMANPNGDDQLEIKNLLRSRINPEAAWSVDLPETKDYQQHRFFVTPPKLSFGFYRVVASLREDFDSERNQILVTKFSMGDLVLTTRRVAPGETEVQALSGSTGNPLAGAKVTLHRYQWQKPSSEVASQVTNAQGTAVFREPPKNKNEYWNYFVMAKQGEDVSLLADGIQFGKNSPPGVMKNALVYTDRSIYRPEQKIHFKVVGYAGESSMAKFQVAKAGETVKVQFRDPNYQVVGERNVKLNSFGSGSGSFVIPAGRPLGSWTIQTSNYSGTVAVQVEEYKRPTFETSLKKAESPYRLNRKANVRGEARYYFGSPVNAGKVSWRVSREEVWPMSGWFWRIMPAPQTPETVASGTAKLESDGSFQFDFVPPADERKKNEKELTYQFRVEVDVTDEGGETRSASRSFRLGFTAVEAKLEMQAGFVRAGEKESIRALLSDLDGKPLAGKAKYSIARLEGPKEAALPADLPVETKISEKDFSLPGDKQRARWETEFQWVLITRDWPEAEKVKEGELSHNAKGEGEISLNDLKRSGVYRLTYRTQDAYGAEFATARDFFVSAPKTEISLPLVLVPEREEFKVGSAARFLVHSGLPNQMVRFEVFRGNQRISVQTLPSGKSLVEIPVTFADRGGFTVLATAWRDHQIMRAQAGVKVPFTDRTLDVKFSTFRDRLRPGQKESFRISVKDPKGHAVAGSEVLAYMYDRSLDLFTQHNYPDLLSLYPDRSGYFPELRYLDRASLFWFASNLPNGPTPLAVQGDQIVFDARYGIGGPGSRGRVGFGYAMEAESMAADSALGARPMAPSASRAMPVALAKGAVEFQTKGLNKAAAPAIPLRANFSESAFFAPHLITGADGTTGVEFTAPESLTSWRVLAHALTKDFRGGSVSRETRTIKELMVRPYLPRFLREGDEAEVKVQVNNSGESALSGELVFDIENNATGKSALADFGVKAGNTKAFKVEKNGSVTLSFALKTPLKVGDYSVRVTARSKNYSDGELRPLPMLPSRMRLAQSRFVTLHNKDRKILEFADLVAGGDATMKNEQMVVTIDAQLFYGVLQALPYILEYPYESVETALNRFVASGIVSSIFAKYPSVGKMAKEFSARKTALERFDEPDANRRVLLEESPWLELAQGGNAADPLHNVLDSEVAKKLREKSLADLRKMQLPSGGFPWFPGGPADEFMTLYVLLGFTHAIEHKVDVPKDMVVKAWEHVRKWLDGRLNELQQKGEGWEAVTVLNFAASGYPDASWTAGLFDDKYRKDLLDFSFKHWKEHSPLLKGYLALTLQRMGRSKDAKLVWDSVMDSAKHDDSIGTYWAREDRSWLWYNDEIETHAFALRTQMELDQKSKHNHGLVQWLFLNKKLNHWKSTRATAEVIYALVHYLEKTAQLGEKDAVKVELGSQTTEFHFDPEKYTGKKNQIVVPGEKINPKAKIEVSKSTPGFAFASATWHFSTEKFPEAEQGDFFQVSRRYFLREHVGDSWQLKPLSEGAKISVGDQIEVQISLRTKHAAEYIHLRDPRPAGLEPETLVSGYKWDLGISWFEEVRDSGTNFFFSELPVGEYTFKYRLRANMNGNFRVGPATVQSLYAPEFNAYSAGYKMKVGD